MERALNHTCCLLVIPVKQINLFVKPYMVALATERSLCALHHIKYPGYHQMDSTDRNMEILSPYYSYLPVESDKWAYEHNLHQATSSMSVDQFPALQIYKPLVIPCMQQRENFTHTKTNRVLHSVGHFSAYIYSYLNLH